MYFHNFLESYRIHLKFSCFTFVNTDGFFFIYLFFLIQKNVCNSHISSSG